jgi:hypothetical protein
MAKQKVYVQESYVYEYEIPTDTEDIEEIIKKLHPATSIGAEFGHIPASVQYMVEDSEWTEINIDFNLEKEI